MKGGQLGGCPLLLLLRGRDGGGVGEGGSQIRLPTETGRGRDEIAAYGKGGDAEEGTEGATKSRLTGKEGDEEGSG